MIPAGTGPRTRRFWTVLGELLCVLLPAVAVLLSDGDYGWSQPAALLGCALLPLRHLWPPLGVLGVLWGLAGGLGWPPALVALYHLGRHTPTLPAVAPWLVLPVAATSVSTLLDGITDTPGAVLSVAYTVVNTTSPALLGVLTGTRARLVGSLAELARARESALAARAEVARSAERVRVGRDIHDSVGQHVTLIAVSAAAIAAATEEEHTRRSAEQVRLLAKRCIVEVRAALGLDNTPAADPGTPVPAPDEPGVGALAALAAEWRSAGMDLTVTDDLDGTELDRGVPVVAAVVYRVVQESLTNAARHAPGAPVRVCLSADGPVRVEVRNAAPAERRDVVGRGGSGLLGLRERVEAVRGEFSAGPGPDGGFSVIAVLPREMVTADTHESRLGGATDDGGVQSDLRRP